MDETYLLKQELRRNADKIEQNTSKWLKVIFRSITCFSYVLMISLDLVKSSEVRKAGDRSNY